MPLSAGDVSCIVGWSEMDSFSIINLSLSTLQWSLPLTSISDSDIFLSISL